MTSTPDETTPATRLEYLRGELRAERISYEELAELQGLRPHIDPGDVELREAAGVPETANAWTAGDVLDDGNTAAGYVGDTATGQGYIIEITRPDVPTARVTMWFAVVEDEEGADFPFAVEEGTEYLIGTDPDDLPGTETYTYLEREAGSHLAYSTAEEAKNEARAMAARARYAINDMGALVWDGVSPLES